MVRVGILTFSDGRDFVHEGAGVGPFAQDVENDIVGALEAAGHDVVRAREIVWTNRLDRGAQRALRGGDAPRALRLPADYPGSRAQAPLAAAQRARSLGEGAEVLHGELVHRVAAHRRVRPRPPLGKPVRPALRRALLPLDRGLGRGDSAGAAASASFVARRGGRGGDARGGAGYGHPRGDARGRGYHRRLE
jgi:hypothetical protein